MSEKTKEIKNFKIQCICGSHPRVKGDDTLSFNATLQAPVVQWMFYLCSGVMFIGCSDLCFNVIHKTSIGRRVLAG